MTKDRVDALIHDGHNVRDAYYLALCEERTNGSTAIQEKTELKKIREELESAIRYNEGMHKTLLSSLRIVNERLEND